MWCGDQRDRFEHVLADVLAHVTDSRKNEPELMNARTWRARKGSMEVMTSRSWHYHGMNHNAMKTRTYVPQKICRDHISDEEGRRDNIPNALAVPKTTTFFHAMTVMDKVEGWTQEKGWDRNSRRVCGLTLKLYCAMDVGAHLRT